MIKSKPFIVFLTLAIFCACATQTTAIRSQSFSQLFQQRSGLIIPAEVTGGESSDCRMEFNDTNGNKQYVSFASGQDLYFVALPAGSYQVTKLICGRGNYSVENQPAWSRFVIFDGNLSYFSMVRFKAQDSEVIFQYPDREQSVAMYKKAWKALSTSDRDRLVLAQDGRKLNEKMQDIQNVGHFQYSQEHAHGFEDIKNPVLECQQKEIIQNHTTLGKTEYNLIYKNGSLSKMAGGSRATNTYSPQFFECIEKAFSQFHPPQGKDVKLSVTL